MGERLWLAKEGTPLAEYYGTELSYTERFTYEVTEEGKVIITGLTEGAKTDKKNRQLVIPKNWIICRWWKSPRGPLPEFRLPLSVCRKSCGPLEEVLFTVVFNRNLRRYFGALVW